MNRENKQDRYSVILNIILWGSLWGIFEATVGYLLHSVSFGYSWLIWYPAACFFMTNVYRKTGRLSSIFFVGLFCASVKMINLFFPGRIDRVINPAISILFEALALLAVVFVVNRLVGEKHKGSCFYAAVLLAMNTGWRLLFIVYLLFLVPDWMRDISVISSLDKFIPFFITQNLITSVILFVGHRFKSALFSPIKAIEQKAATLPAVPAIKTGIAGLMLCAALFLEVVL